LREENACGFACDYQLYDYFSDVHPLGEPAGAYRSPSASLKSAGVADLPR
jgi:hypothetical protein